MTNIALYPGTFDPITHGHLSIINKASQVFEQVVVGVSTSRQNTLLPAADRLQLVQHSCQNLPQTQCTLYDGLTATYAKKINAAVILRGMRSLLDFAPEQAMVTVNKHYAPNTVTMFIIADNHLDHISSTLVKEIYAAGGDLTNLVPTCVVNFLKEKE